MSQWIVTDPNICGGKPTIKGTRIMVKNILGMMAGGYTVEKILSAYPELTEEMIRAALEYAAAVIDEEQVATTAPDRRRTRQCLHRSTSGRIQR